MLRNQKHYTYELVLLTTLLSQNKRLRSFHIRVRPICSTTVTGPVGERLQAGTKDAPVLDHPAPLRHHDSGAGYKYPDLLTYLLTPCEGFR